MPEVDLPEVFAAQVIFWILLPFVLFTKPKWAVLGWLLMGNLDTTGPGQFSSMGVGWINAVKGVALPLYLCWRLRGVTGETTSTVAARLWLLLTACAAISIVWTPFPLAASKLVGNMLGILLSIMVLEKAARWNLISRNSCVILISGSLLLAVIQTFAYGGAIYGFDGPDQPSRFSSFVSAQQFAAFLVAFLAIVLWHPDLSGRLRTLLSLILGVALILNGSRAWVFGALLVLLVHSWLRYRRALGILAFAGATATLFAAMTVNMTSPGDIIMEQTQSRVLATANALLTGTDTLHNVGLRDLTFRLAIYDGVLSELRTGSTRAILIGHGTSSGGNAALRIFPNLYRADQIDPNRTIHSEWLRALYEWGVLGLVLLIGVFASMIVGLVSRYRTCTDKLGASAVLSFLPAFLAGVSSENILAGAGNAVTLSLALITAFLWIPSKIRVTTPGISVGD